ncbi:LamB/YcsF family protein [Gordonia sp. zg691]|uniref:5-oxoprolinase subunit A n=1 Tax=Gordonia jinghuaiqii TaxID=2758710 RepID=A0A7D7LWV1_9ACTN|nr:5-oxoprolinase subunit PxpA [Gordonia jinghuaiqii]MBD0861840.1 LamB/YcsF family protein [Gordonia jinghuaiqii]MCR5977732.1 5-oxoprolinase subunit PxpA [Gordonia jinghuaiqii]QMT02395.1 LamB/YcsF family protein [Gordonia jinghuaiqii]
MDAAGPRIDLNADLGEGLGDDAAMLTIVTSANVACGFHAGNPADLLTTCRAAVAAGVRIGAQVSYPDRSGFGRRFMEMTTPDLVADLVYQIGALDALARSVGGAVTYVKPHGALYNTVVHHIQQADAVVTAVRDVNPGLAVMGLAGSQVLARAERAGLPIITEAFADRAYTPEGTLVPRGEQGAVLSDSAAIAGRVVEMTTSGRVTAIDGTVIGVDAESICLHGDTPGALGHARAVREALAEAGVLIRAS